MAGLSGGEGGAGCAGSGGSSCYDVPEETAAIPARRGQFAGTAEAAVGGSGTPSAARAEAEPPSQPRPAPPGAAFRVFGAKRVWRGRCSAPRVLPPRGPGVAAAGKSGAGGSAAEGSGRRARPGRRGSVSPFAMVVLRSSAARPPRMATRDSRCRRPPFDLLDSSSEFISLESPALRSHRVWTRSGSARATLSRGTRRAEEAVSAVWGWGEHGLAGSAGLRAWRGGGGEPVLAGSCWEELRKR